MRSEKRVGVKLLDLPYTPRIYVSLTVLVNHTLRLVNRKTVEET